MEDFALWIYIGLILVILYILIRVFCSIMCRKQEALQQPPTTEVRRRVVQQIRIDPETVNPVTVRDRQGNIFTIADDTTRNSGAHRYADFFYIEPSVEDAARIRAQLDKDDKDLPTYDEVIGMTNQTTAAPSTTTVGVSTTSIATTVTMLPVPPYSEVDPHSPTTPTVATTNTTTNSVPAQPQPSATASTSTSRAAISSVTIPIVNSASNSNV